MNRIRATATFIILLFASIMGCAFSAIAQYEEFNAQKATKQLENIDYELSTKAFNYEELYSTVKLIKNLHDEANDCVNKGKIHLQKIDDLLKNNPISQN